MKKIVIFLSLIILATACQKGTDKAAELAKLQKQKDQLTEQITKLQAEIEAANPGKAAAGKIKNVAVSAVILKPFNHFIEIQGRVDGDENIGVNAKMPGVVSRVYVKVGDHVSKGQILAELEAETTKKQLDQMKDQLAFVTTLYNKQKNLWDQKIGSEIQYLTAKNNKENLERSVQTLKETLALSIITSPINGTIEDVPLRLGQSVPMAGPAVRVINFSNVKVVADIAEAYANRVKSGDMVKIFFPDYNKDVDAKLSFASKFINPTNRTFQVEARMAAPADNFKANMIAVLKINDYNVAQAISIPVNSIQKSQTGQFIFLAKEEKGQKVARKQPVTVGMIYNGLAEIKSGLTTGDKVITIGFQDLFDGQAIQF
ncbi:MAG: efflux RND transporter periplasmic adaptor subunit [Bacteroidota bacterium]